MKILVLNGSPKVEKSTTMLLTSSFINGIETKEKCKVKIISTYNKNINYCKGDLSCWMRQDGHCIIQDDDMNGILDEMKASDIIIWSFPLHCHSFPTSMKAVIDRTIAFFKLNMVQTGSVVDHEKTMDLSSKRNVFIVGGGYPYYPDNFAPIKALINTYFKTSRVMGVCETALLDAPAPELEPLKTALFDKFRKAGEEYYETGSISDELIISIEQPMIPNEAYLGIINGMASGK